MILILFPEQFKISIIADQIFKLNNKIENLIAFQHIFQSVLAVPNWISKILGTILPRFAKKLFIKKFAKYELFVKWNKYAFLYGSSAACKQRKNLITA